MAGFSLDMNRTLQQEIGLNLLEPSCNHSRLSCSSPRSQPHLPARSPSSSPLQSISLCTCHVTLSTILPCFHAVVTLPSFRIFQLHAAALRWGRQDEPPRPRWLAAVGQPQTAVRWPHQSVRLESAVVTPHPGSIGSLENSCRRVSREKDAVRKGQALAWRLQGLQPTGEIAGTQFFSTENHMKTVCLNKSHGHVWHLFHYNKHPIPPPTSGKLTSNLRVSSQQWGAQERRGVQLPIRWWLLAPSCPTWRGWDWIKICASRRDRSIW